jgi:hypothetical protein
VSVARLLSVRVYAPLSRLCAMNPRIAMDCIARADMPIAAWSMRVAAQNKMTRSCAVSFVVSFSMAYSRRQLLANAAIDRRGVGLIDVADNFAVGQHVVVIIIPLAGWPTKRRAFQKQGLSGRRYRAVYLCPNLVLPRASPRVRWGS